MLFELPSFEHVHAKDVKEAAFWLRKSAGKANVIAGGTDLLGLMKDQIKGPEFKAPEVLVNIKTIPGFSRIIEDEDGGLRIGSAVTLSHLMTSKVTTGKFGILTQAARVVGTTQIRNMGTVGGNLLQRPRCMYFRHPHFICFKKGGAKCYAIQGEHRYYHAIFNKGKCAMAHPSDLAVALITLDAKVVLVSLDRERRVNLKDLFSGPNSFQETILDFDEMLTEIHVPRLKDRSYQTFVKEQVRHSADFALVSVGIFARVTEGTCREIRIVLGGVASFPYLASKAEEILKGKRLDEALISKAVEASAEGARPLSMNSYKVDLTKALVRRALTSIRHDSLSG